METGYQRSAFSKEENKFFRTWVDPTASQAVIDSLHKRYPNHDKDLAPEKPADPQ